MKSQIRRLKPVCCAKIGCVFSAIIKIDILVNISYIVVDLVNCAKVKRDVLRSTYECIYYTLVVGG